MQAEYADTSEEDKKQALGTLLEQSRVAVSDAKEGHERVWRITAGYIFGNTREAPKAETEQPDPPA